LQYFIGTNAHQFKDVTTRGSYYPDKSMDKAAVCHICPQSSLATFTKIPQNPPLYLHVTSTSKSGLEQAVAKIEELMQQELPNLVDERRFRRREPEQFERDEFGRVCIFHLPRRQFWLI
jgi:hypothetical protein